MRRILLAVSLVLAAAFAGSSPPVQAHGPYPPGVDRARDWLRARTNGTQFRCANVLWDKESHWRVHAGETWGSYGIPQATPGRKMRSAERPWKGRAWDDWVNDALVQVSWGRGYVRGRYGSFCAALRFQNVNGWY